MSHPYSREISRTLLFVNHRMSCFPLDPFNKRLHDTEHSTSSTFRCRAIRHLFFEEARSINKLGVVKWYARNNTINIANSRNRMSKLGYALL